MPPPLPSAAGCCRRGAATATYPANRPYLDAEDEQAISVARRWVDQVIDRVGRPREAARTPSAKNPVRLLRAMVVMSGQGQARARPSATPLHRCRSAKTTCAM